jgi:proteasome lid subunit RPN8/RPN11
VLQDKTEQDLLLALNDSSGLELCGFILKDGGGKQSLRRVANMAGTAGAFLISALDWRRTLRYAKAEGLEILAVVHSHSSSTEMSEVDRKHCDNLGLPFVIVRVHGDKLDYRVYRAHAPGALP